MSTRVPGDTGWLASSYLGNIFHQSHLHQQQLVSSARTLIAAMQSGAPELSARSILTTILDSGFPKDAEKMLTLTRIAPDARLLIRTYSTDYAYSRKLRNYPWKTQISIHTIRRNLFDTFLIPLYLHDEWRPLAHRRERCHYQHRALSFHRCDADKRSSE